ncbi:MAG TPA: 3-oxoacyl-[acyl-carrier-protein] reductase [Candidatus Gemmiger stercoravium]|nr:3-oxoacyl-[acyl-carrier-protein] reductase [Candidatus Gemmiger stercoravium]
MAENTRPTALVTGGGRGIGRAITLALAEAGFDVCINYAGNAAAAEQTAEAARALGARAFIRQADVTDPAACKALVEGAAADLGRLDVLVNNAGVTRDCLLMRLTEEDYDKVLDTNLKGAVFCCKAVSRLMMKQRYGRIINMSSVVGLRGNAGQVNYSASKAGLIGLTKSLAKELATRGVTVNAVAPGFVGTEMTDAMPEAAKAATLASIPAGRIADPDEIARAVEFFAAEGSGYITGQVLCVDGGMAM